MDGSLGIVFNYKGTWRVSTRGSFSSIQAKTAMELLDQYYVEDCHDHLTFLVEIIYPANRISPGARLVVDYGDKSFLCLLAVMNRDTGLELSRTSVRHLSQVTEMPMVKQYDHTIEEMIALQKTLPKDREGFVVRFASGFRIKIKGTEYCKMQKIINSITPLNLWALMEPDNKFIVPDSYLMTIPEEYRSEAIEIIGKLQDAAVDTMFELSHDLQKVEEAVKDLTDYKAIGLYLKDNRRQLKYPEIVFPYLRNGAKAVNAYVHKVIRPTNNLLKGD
jgi:RNA ligase